MDADKFKNDFCFVVISYNQEKYVFEHLESIKYNIEKFGAGKRIQLIFSDDGSKDSTVEKARFWLDKNSYLFNEYKIIEHEKNIGTIRNMIDAIGNVNALHFKEMACDDLYYKNNIFEFCSNEKIVLTPPIHFFEPDKVLRKIAPEYIIFLHHKNNIREKIKKMLAYNQCISSPGVMVPSFVWKNEGFKNYLLQYKYIEDIPEWDYLFNKNDFGLQIEICGTPVVLYRRNVGVAENLKKPGNPINDDYINIRKTIKAKQDLRPKCLNPYAYPNFFEFRISTHFYKMEPNIKETLDKWDMNITKTRDFLKYLKGKAETAEKSYVEARKLVK